MMFGICCSLFSLLLIGCANNYPVLVLYPHRVKADCTKQNKSCDKQNKSLVVAKKKQLDLLPIECYESIKSVNVPILNEDGKLSCSKDFIWLRPPAQLAYEYIKNRLKELNIQSSQGQKCKIVLVNCYIDQISKEAYVEFDLYIEEKYIFSVKKVANQEALTNIMIEAIEELLQLLIFNCEN